MEGVPCLPPEIRWNVTRLRNKRGDLRCRGGSAIACQNPGAPRSSPGKGVDRSVQEAVCGLEGRGSPAKSLRLKSFGETGEQATRTATGMSASLPVQGDAPQTRSAYPAAKPPIAPTRTLQHKQTRPSSSAGRFSSVKEEVPVSG